MSGRTYLTFGSDDEKNWELLKPVEASGSDQALTKALQQETHRHYAVVPARNWSAATPTVKQREPVVTWKPIEVPGQIAERPAKETPKPAAKIDDEKQLAVDAAKEALAAPVGGGRGAYERDAE